MPRGRKRCSIIEGDASRSQNILEVSSTRRRLNSPSTSYFLSNELLQPTTPPMSDQSIEDLATNSMFLDLGDPTEVCCYCGALFWIQEKCKSSSRKNSPKYKLCCRSGRVSLPLLQNPPSILSTLFDTTNGPDSVHFVESIRKYNCAFAFSSMGVNVDNKINDGRGPYIFKISGQACHLIGSLLPPEGQVPRYAQLYMYDTTEELEHRVTTSNAPRQHIVEALKDMLDQCNPIVQAFRSIRERVLLHEDDSLRLCIRGDRNRNNRQYFAPTAAEVIGLVVGDINAEEDSRDIIIEHRSGQLHRINCVHPSFMALNYPLLFPYGEDSYVDGIPYNINSPEASNIKRDDVSMNEYYCYRLHIRNSESDHLFRSSRLFQQFVVDMYSCVEQSRLWYIRKNQKKLRADTYNNIRNAAIEGDMVGSQIGQHIILPASHVGSPRYLFQKYQNAIAICRHLGPPHLFITFTCNPMWPEIT